MNLSKAIKCRKVNIYVADHECEYAQRANHSYCRKCSLRAESPAPISFDGQSYYRFLKELLEDAFDIVTRGPDWLKFRYEKWTEIGAPEDFEDRKAFLGDMEDCAAIQQNITITKKWFLSQSEDIGSFRWLCFHSARYGCNV